MRNVQLHGKNPGKMWRKGSENKVWAKVNITTRCSNIVRTDNCWDWTKSLVTLAKVFWWSGRNKACVVREGRKKRPFEKEFCYIKTEKRGNFWRGMQDSRDFFLWYWGLEPRTSYILGKCSTTELHLQSSLMEIFHSMFTRWLNWHSTIGQAGTNTQAESLTSVEIVKTH